MRVDGDHGHLGDLFRYPHFCLRSSLSFSTSAHRRVPGVTLFRMFRSYRHQSEKVAGYFLTGTLGCLWSGPVRFWHG